MATAQYCWEKMKCAAGATTTTRAGFVVSVEK
jgi:hypothetical protein